MDQVPSHADILARIEQVESELKEWTLTGVWRVIIVVGPLLAGALLTFAVWVSQTHANQTAFNADINARVQGNKESLEQARAAQTSMMNKLDEIHRFMREDSRELRDTLSTHIREARKTNDH